MAMFSRVSGVFYIVTPVFFNEISLVGRQLLFPFSDLYTEDGVCCPKLCNFVSVRPSALSEIDLNCSVVSSGWKR
jgi:hypothetical protein